MICNPNNSRRIEFREQQKLADDRDFATMAWLSRRRRTRIRSVEFPSGVEIRQRVLDKPKSS